MAKNLYVRRADTVFGPMDVGRLKRLAANGKLRPTDEVRKDGDDTWWPAGKVRGLEFPARDDLTLPVADEHDTVEDAATKEAETLAGPVVDVNATLPVGRTDTIGTSSVEAYEDIAVPGYQILGELGRGGMGVVYRAKQIKLKRLVALKMILAGQHSGQTEIARFQAEAEAVAQLAHPNIVHIYEVGDHQGLPYFSLEYVDGGSLDDLLEAEDVDGQRAAELVLTLARAIHYAHEKGIVHRDLKPANVLVSSEGKLKITDFGLAKQVEVESGHTQTGAILGTPSYMAPEQASGDTKTMGPLTDVYALGAVLYRILTGRPPFQNENPLDTVMEVLEKDPVRPRRLNEDVPVDLETICLKCLEKDADRRYTSAAALADDLERFIGDEPIAARPSGSIYRVWRRVRRNRTTTILMAAVVLIAVTGGWLSWSLYEQSGKAVEKAADVQKALDRVQDAVDIQQLAIVPFRNTSGSVEDNWIGGAFSSDLETKLSGDESLKLMAASAVQSTIAAMELPSDDAIDDSMAQSLGSRMVVDHVIVGDFQRLGDQIQVSARVINVDTGVIDRSVQVRGKFPDDVFGLQDELAQQCLAMLNGTLETDDQTEAQADVVPAAPFVADDSGRSNLNAINAWVLFGQGKHALQNRKYEEAIRLLSEAVQKDPQLWMAYRSLGWAYQKSYQVEEAISAFEDAMRVNPDDIISTAMHRLMSGRITEGFALLDKAKERGQHDLDLFKTVASHRLRSADPDELPSIQNDIETAIDQHPNDHELLELLASTHEELGDDESSLDVLLQAVQREPADFGVHLRLFLLHDRRGDRTNAQREYRLAEQHRPEGANGLREFGQVFLNADRSDLAIDVLEQAREADPNHPFTYALLGNAYATKDLRRSFEMIQKAHELKPHSQSTISGLCRIANIVQRIDVLEEQAKAWAKAAPDSYEAHQYLRIAYQKRNLPDKVAEQDAILAKLTPSHASFFFWTGNSLIQAQQFDEATTLLQRGHEQFPENKGIAGLMHLSEGLQLMLSRQFNEAIPALKRCGDFMPDLPDVPMLLMQCHLVSRQQDAAAEQAMQLIRLSNRNFATRLAAYEVLNKIGRDQEAIASIQEALKSARTLSYRHMYYLDMLRIHLSHGRTGTATDVVRNLIPKTEGEWIMKLHISRLLTRTRQSKEEWSNEQRRKLLADLMGPPPSPLDTIGGLGPAFVVPHLVALDAPQSWATCGPFTGDAPLQVEDEIDLDGTVGPDGKVRWRRLTQRVGEYVDLLQQTAKAENVYAYAYSRLISPHAQRVTFYVGSDDGVEVWLNRKPIFQHQVGRSCKEGEDQFRSTLQPGVNELLIKIEQQSADWGFAIDAFDELGMPANIVWSVDDGA